MFIYQLLTPLVTAPGLTARASQHQNCLRSPVVWSCLGLFVLGEPTHDREDLEEKQRALPDPNRVKAYIIPAGSLGP